MKKFTIKTTADILIEVEAESFSKAMKLIDNKFENSQGIYIRPIDNTMDCNEDMDLEGAKEKYFIQKIR